MSGWMAVMRLVLFPAPRLTPASPVFRSGTRVAMVFGFVASWPANVWLIRRGIKEPM